MASRRERHGQTGDPGAETGPKPSKSGKGERRVAGGDRVNSCSAKAGEAVTGENVGTSSAPQQNGPTTGRLGIGSGDDKEMTWQWEAQ